MKKTAIVYDWMDSWGGAERLLEVVHEMFPKADWYTSYTDEEKATWSKNIKPYTSFIQTLPGLIRNNRKLSALLYPFAFESFDFSDYDIVLSISSSFAKSVVTRPETNHVGIVLTPTRFLWSHAHIYHKPNMFTKPVMKHMKQWDLVAAQRPDKLIAISKSIQKRIKKYYNRESDIIYPPFDPTYWKKLKQQKPRLNTPNDYYLIISRLEPYKNIDKAVKAFNKLTKKHLIVVGKGSLVSSIQSMAKSNVTFMKDLTDRELAYLYSNAQALIMPQEEDFGYTALEAQTLGCPVIAYKKGGALETVHADFGVLYTKSLRKAVENFQPQKYTLDRTLEKKLNKHIDNFSVSKFKSQLQKNL